MINQVSVLDHVWALLESDRPLSNQFRQISEARQRELADAVNRVRDLIAEYSLTAKDVFPPARSPSTKADTKLAPKYRDPATGRTWSGCGKSPKWTVDQDCEKFAI